MDNRRWHWICLLLCLVGIFKEFRPSEPYVTKFFVKYKNVTRDEVTHVLYPIGTYTYLGTLPIIFLITDFLRYKAIVVFECLSFVACYALLIWGQGLTNLKVVEVLYGFTSSCEVAYYTYIYAKVKKENFKKVTSYIHTAIIIGNLVAALSAQAFVSTELLDIRELTFLTLGSCVCALVLACFLPAVTKSIYFHNHESSSLTTVPVEEKKNENGDEIAVEIRHGGQAIPWFRNTFYIFWIDLKVAYSNSYILKWSVWWALAAAGNQMIRNYVQALWEAYDNGTDMSKYNGAVDAVHTFLSTILALGVGSTKIPWSKYGEPFLAAMCFLQGGLLFWMALANSLLIAYATYIFLRVSFQVMITVASAEVALQISPNSYGLIFGFNRFISLIIQTMLTFLINDVDGLALSERGQFLAYAIYHLGIALCYSVAFVVICYRSRSISRTSLQRPGSFTSKLHQDALTNAGQDVRGSEQSSMLI